MPVDEEYFLVVHHPSGLLLVKRVVGKPHGRQIDRDPSLLQVTDQVLHHFPRPLVTLVPSGFAGVFIPEPGVIDHSVMFVHEVGTVRQDGDLGWHEPQTLQVRRDSEVFSPTSKDVQISPDSTFESLQVLSRHR